MISQEEHDRLFTREIVFRGEKITMEKDVLDLAKAIWPENWLEKLDSAFSYYASKFEDETPDELVAALNNIIIQSATKCISLSPRSVPDEEGNFKWISCMGEELCHKSQL